VDSVDWVVGDTFEDSTQIGFWIEAVEFRGLDQGQDAGGTFATFVRSREEPVLAAERDGPDAPLGSVVVDLDGAVVDEASEGLPPGDGISDCLRRAGFARQLLQHPVQPGSPGLKARPGLLLPNVTASVRRSTADSGLDVVEGADVPESLLGNGCGPGYREIEGLAPHMRHAGGFQDRRELPGLTRFIQFPEAGITVGMEHAPEACQMGSRMLAFLSGE